jgi:flagellar hook-basal body complex protein FliE
MDRVSVESVLNEIRAMQEMAAGRGSAARAPEAADGGGFSAALRAQIEQVNGAQNQATQMARDFESGAKDVNLQDVMISMQKANISFQTMIQVRNRVVSAYQDMMNMQV